ncbi:MAG TPA: glycosyltransferase [Gaiellaceae bacterium]|jgi:glycosyltransferase involved in cell wall biosynthesis
MPLVSAAIITHNRARYLDDAISSVLGQTFGDLELIVVDDGSTDGTEDVVARHDDPRVRYIRQDHRGKAVARNTAFQLAGGNFVAFCDSDDYWCPDRLERQLAVFEEHPSVGMVHGQVDLVDSVGRPLPERTASQRALFAAAHRKRATYASYAFNCCCLSSTILVRREVFDTVGPYDCELPIEDYDFYLRLVLDFEVLFLDGAPLAIYRVHGDKTTDHELGAGQIRTAEKHLALLAERADIPDARLARRNFNLMIAQSWKVLGDRRRARPAALRAFRLGAPGALRFAL